MKMDDHAATPLFAAVSGTDADLRRDTLDRHGATVFFVSIMEKGFL